MLGISIDELLACEYEAFKKNRKNLFVMKNKIIKLAYDKMKSLYGDNPTGQAFELKESVYRGRYSNGTMPQETERFLLECDIPAWYIQNMKKIKYLSSKTRLILLLKKDIYHYLKSLNMENIGRR